MWRCVEGSQGAACWKELRCLSQIVVNAIPSAAVVALGNLLETSHAAGDGLNTDVRVIGGQLAEHNAATRGEAPWVRAPHGDECRVGGAGRVTQCHETTRPPDSESWEAQKAPQSA